MMKSTISSEILADPEINRIVESANEILLGHVGTAPHPPEAVWKKATMNGDGATVELDLRYFDADLATRFTSKELEDTSELRYRVLDIWGDLIVKNNRQTCDRMLKVFQEWEQELDNGHND